MIRAGAPVNRPTKRDRGSQPGLNRALRDQARVAWGGCGVRTGSGDDGTSGGEPGTSLGGTGGSGGSCGSGGSSGRSDMDTLLLIC
jgi:hypothetical protein